MQEKIKVDSFLKVYDEKFTKVIIKYCKFLLKIYKIKARKTIQEN